MNRKEFVNVYLPSIKELVGMDIINNSTDDAVKLEITTLTPIIQELNEEYFENLITPFEKILEEYYPILHTHKDLYLYRNIIIEKYIENCISLNFKTDVLFSFIDKLKFLSTCTYEQSQANISFILFSDSKLNIETELNSLSLDYLPFSTPLSLTEIIHDKLTYKIIDSLSTSLVLNDSLQITGIAKKKKNGISIYDIMTNRYKSIQELKLKNNIYNYFLRQLDLSRKNKAILDELQQKVNELLNLPNNTPFNELKNLVKQEDLKKINIDTKR